MSSEIGEGLFTGIKQVAAAGTRVALEGTKESAAAKTVTIEALGTNEGVVVVGDKSVVAAPGSHATPTQRGIALAAKAVISIEIDDPAEVFLDATKSGDGVSYLVLLT
jgi:hypothetical protein